MKTKEMQRVMENRKKTQTKVEKELYEAHQRQRVISNIKNIPDPIKHPDPKKHQQISFIKSGVRIVACLLGFAGMYQVGFLGLFLAELIGVYEELV